MKLPKGVKIYKGKEVFAGEIPDKKLKELGVKESMYDIEKLKELAKK